MNADHSSHPKKPSNPKKRPKKLKKPRADFPLTPHRSRQWCKKVLGKIHYFGRDADEALNRWLDEKDDLLAGRLPRSRTADAGAARLRDVVNKFMDAKDAKLRSGELTMHTWRDDDSACDELIKAFGPARLVADLRPEDFAKLRASWTAKWSNVRIKKFVTITREVFKFAFTNDVIEKPVKYGSEFETPSALTLRKDRNAKGVRMFEAEEIRRMIDAAAQPLKAMILLGANGGLGNNDCAMLPLDAVDLDSGWVLYPRPKTGIMRKIPLWPETIVALRDWLACRPEPRDEAFAGLFFLTSAGGSFVSDDYPVCRKTCALLGKLKIGGHRNFYGLRRTFETVAGESRDQVAVDSVMGHVDPSMGAVYRQGLSDGRLQDVVNFVRAWLFAAQEKGKAPRLKIASEEGQAATSA